MTVWSDAALHVMATKGPRQRAIADLLFEVPEGVERVRVMNISRSLLESGYVKGDWLDVVRVVVAAQISGADVERFREIVLNRGWSARRIVAQKPNGRNSHR